MLGQLGSRGLDMLGRDMRVELATECFELATKCLRLSVSTIVGGGSSRSIVLPPRHEPKTLKLVVCGCLRVCRLAWWAAVTLCVDGGRTKLSLRRMENEWNQNVTRNREWK